jgi:hypothetical protein
MPISPEHLSALRKRLWHSDATDASRGTFRSRLTGLPPRRDGSGVTEFRAHRQAAFDALSGMSARYEPIAGHGPRLAAHATVTEVHSAILTRPPHYLPGPSALAW